MPFGPLRLRPEAKQLNGIDDTVELPNVDKPTRWEADVTRFFELTFPTQTLRQNIFTVVERFNHPIGAKGVFLIESPYGSGKSHLLLTLVHVLKCQPAAQQWIARWPPRERPASLPTNLMVHAHSFVEKSPADFVNDVLLPLLGLPPQANRMVDVELLEGAMNSSPTLGGRRLVLILDELARWFSNLRSQPNGEQLVSRAEAFLQAAGNLAKRTDKLTLILSALPGLLPQDVQANIVRNAVQLPLRASDQQGVILHRIFENYDPGTVHPGVRSMVESYRNAYTQASLPVEEVNRLCEDLLKTYPIHPDFMKLVVERFPKGSYFQNERGALNFVARVVSLAEDAGVTIVTPAHANVRDAVILRKLNNVDTSGHDLPRIAFDDLQNLPQQDPLHDQIMATVLTYSLVDNRDPGARAEEVLRACTSQEWCPTTSWPACGPFRALNMSGSNKIATCSRIAATPRTRLRCRRGVSFSSTRNRFRTTSPSVASRTSLAGSPSSSMTRHRLTSSWHSLHPRWNPTRQSLWFALTSLAQTSESRSIKAARAPTCSCSLNHSKPATMCFLTTRCSLRLPRPKPPRSSPRNPAKPASSRMLALTRENCGKRTSRSRTESVGPTDGCFSGR